MMDKTYDPASIEQTIYQQWQTADYFAPSGKGENYCIVIPPPNVTGSLHMGHGFQLTLMDMLVRYHRMQGYNTLWQVGTDHAGIATQMVVERQLLAQGKTRHDLGRETFVDRVWEWKEQSGGMITAQMRRLGISVDWSREHFSMDAQLSAAVLYAFEKLYDDGLIYRGKRLVNWDPSLHTAVSDLEVVNEEKAGEIYYIRYLLVDKTNEYIVIATTRPETLFGDVAVAVNPNDERYQHLIGHYLQLPLTNRTIPVIADDYVDASFGSGCVKITPAHDFNDYALAQRHQLPLINIFTMSAELNEEAPEDYRGLERFSARKRVITDLETAGFLDEIKPHTLMIPRNDRGNTILEPYLTEQWYVKMQSLAETAIAAVKEEKTRFIPENWSKTYFQWLENIQDWCISRQLWWGHRIPAWYDADGNAYVGADEAAVRNKYHLSEEVILQQDNDVLDTWFSAALWPFASLDWPQADNKIFETFYPTSVLITGFDIIFFWVARMMMFGLYFTGTVPFRDVYITGLIRDEKGQKMSKSKGNVLDPIDLVDGIDVDSLVAKRIYGLMQPAMCEKIEKATRKQFADGIPSSGTDALRFTYCALANTGRDIKFDLQRLEGYRNFCNKLWNATRFVLMNIENQTLAAEHEVQLSLPDQWIISLLQQTITQVEDYLIKYRFDLVAQILYEFVWNEYCDWYLELSKSILTGNVSERQKASTRRVLLTVLETILRLLHPIMPFITESIWQTIAPLLNIPGKTIMLQPYPRANNTLVNAAAIDDVNCLKRMITGIRNIRGEMNISPAKQLTLLIAKGTLQEKNCVEKNNDLLKTLAKLDTIEWLNGPAPAAATALAGDMELFIPLAGNIDKDAEIRRLQKEITKLQQDIERIKQKLTNPHFVDKAPADVIEKEQQKQKIAADNLEKLQVQLAKMQLL